MDIISHLKLAFYWGSKIRLAFVKHVKKDPPDSPTEEMNCLVCCSSSLRSVLTSIRLPALKKHYWASKPISHLTRWKQERLGFRSERILAIGDRLYEHLWAAVSRSTLWLEWRSKPEAFSSSLIIFYFEWIRRSSGQIRENMDRAGGMDDRHNSYGEKPNYLAKRVNKQTVVAELQYSQCHLLQAALSISYIYSSSDSRRNSWVTDHPAFSSYETGHASESNSVGSKQVLMVES